MDKTAKDSGATPPGAAIAEAPSLDEMFNVWADEYLFRSVIFGETLPPMEEFLADKVAQRAAAEGGVAPDSNPGDSA